MGILTNKIRSGPLGGAVPDVRRIETVAHRFGSFGGRGQQLRSDLHGQLRHDGQVDEDHQQRTHWLLTFSINHDTCTMKRHLYSNQPV